jgi:glucose-1-phosphate adenylyltransferase
VSRDSIVSPGCVVAGGSIETSVLSPNVRVQQGATVDQSVILSHTSIGRNAVIHRAILDKHVVVPDDAKIGIDSEADEARGFYVSEGGITVVPKGTRVSPT